MNNEGNTEHVLLEVGIHFIVQKKFLKRMKTNLLKEIGKVNERRHAFRTTTLQLSIFQG